MIDLKGKDLIDLDMKKGTFTDVLTLKGVIKILLEIQVRVPVVKKIILPKKVSMALAMLEGKIRAQIFRKALKEELLQDTQKLRKKLKKGDFQGAFFLMSKIHQKIQHSITVQPAKRERLTLVLYDLMVFKEELTKIL